MSDLIDREAALNCFHSWADKYGDVYTPDDNPEYRAIEDLPSIEQPEIIHCKDCKWSDWYDAADGHRYCYCMETGAAGRTADDFCSYAEREEA